MTVATASLFSQLLSHFPRAEFASLVNQHNAEYATKGFGCWTQFVAMLFCQLAKADLLREICNGLSCCLGKLTHLRIPKAPTSRAYPTPIFTIRPNFTKTFFGQPCTVSGSRAKLGGARPNSDSKTNY